MFGQVDTTSEKTTEAPASHSTDVDSRPVIPTPVTSVPAIKEPTITKSNLEVPLESGNASDPVRPESLSTGEQEQSDSATAEAITRAAEEAEKELQRLREAVDRARKSYQAEVARQDQKLLDEFGGPDWAAVRQQVELAEAAKQPEVATERFNKATVLLKDAIPVITDAPDGRVTRREGVSNRV